MTPRSPAPPARALWRGWVHLLLGGALLMPYMLLGALVAELVGAGRATDGYGAVTDPRVFLAVLPVVAASGLVLPVRRVETTAARELLGVALPDPADEPRERPSWDRRRRTAAWFTAHLAVGGIAGGLTLALVPFALWIMTLPFVEQQTATAGATTALPSGWAAAWALPAGPAVLALLALAIRGAAAALARLGPALLGPSPAERLAQAEARSRRLAERNRLARELHDSVGHALSVITVQAGAAARLLDTDTEFARTALTSVEECARSALEELDHVLGLLREERPDGVARQPALGDLPALVERAGTGGQRVELVVDGPPGTVPAAVSREAYRIVQEGVTNALRHAGEVPVRVGLRVRERAVELEITNELPAAPRTPGRGRAGGRGLMGMRERVEVLRGEMEAGEMDGAWVLKVRLPW
ncbi:sensor histidine kinase [Allostreptomyces psammosilenae]|uniref:histidine kinase n=1 Tax=Allostreptomyces psammosilenae TaxID=1892865 RepID=A0A853A658_9ACTN|nr:histidine kinase [Allostreptomyces psammosilenae]NYI08334.1 signal transduction histidine kinase [Allostreptomyces psammosilenae]